MTTSPVKILDDATVVDLEGVVGIAGRSPTLHADVVVRTNPDFRGNLDNWDPALVDALADARRVITFDNSGVGGSTGFTPPHTIAEMASDVIAFVAAMRIEDLDLPRLLHRAGTRADCPRPRRRCRARQLRPL